MVFSTRFGRLLFILLSAAFLALSAMDDAKAHNLNLGTATSTSIDTDTHWWNDVSVKTWNGYQYMAYWDAPDVTTGQVYLVVARRTLSTNAITTIRFDSTHGDQYLIRTADGHNYVALALSPVDGRIHISWSNHYNPTEVWSTSGEAHHYGLSSSGCLSQATFTNCTFSFPSGGHSGGNSAQNRLTYPIYVNDRNNNLYFFYRCGVSEKGNEFMHIYNNNGTWTDRGLIIEGRANVSDVCRGGGSGGGSWDVDGPGGPLASQTNRGVYMYGVVFDKNDRLHISWGWREFNIHVQHDLYYAYSDYNDGATANIGTKWRGVDGTQYGTAGGSDSLRMADTSLGIPGAYEYPGGGGTSNHNMKVDSRNQPHWVLYAYDAAGVTYNQHIWRTAGTNGTDGIWYLQYITPAGENTGQFSDFAFDRSDNIYYFSSSNYHDWSPYNADGYVQAELATDRVTWQGGEYLDVQLQSGVTALQTSALTGIPIGLGTNDNKQFRVRMKNNTTSTQATIYWQTAADPTWTGKSQTFTITASDAVYKDYTFTITDADWTGTLGLVEFDPVGVGVVSTGSVSIDYIRVTNTSGTVAKAWEFQQGVKMVGEVVMSANNWASWEPGIDLFSGLSMAWGTSDFRPDRQRYLDSGWLSIPVIEQGTALQEKLAIKEIDISGDDEIIEWDFDVDPIAWTAPNHITSFGWAIDAGGGTIGGTLSGNDPQIKSMDNLRAPIGSTDYIHISLKNTTVATTGRVYFITEADGTYNTTKSKTFPITANSTYAWYHINMSAVSGWTGQTLRQLRVDPTDVAGVSTGSFKIDKISINDSPTTP